MRRLLPLALLAGALLAVQPAAADNGPCYAPRSNPENSGQCATVSSTAVTLLRDNGSRCAAEFTNKVGSGEINCAWDRTPTASVGFPIPQGGSWSSPDSVRPTGTLQCIRTGSTDATVCVQDYLPR